MRELYIGLMSGTSLDGVDAVVVELSGALPHIVGSAYVPFEADLREQLFALNQSGFGEIDAVGRLGNELAKIYALAVELALSESRLLASSVLAIGCHGQTVRHRPELGFTLQIGNPALLAERTGIVVAADFRSRDVAAGGQGAPLVPAFHAAVFSDSAEYRTVLNLGGIANITFLPIALDVRGFDIGPGNCLMDAWTQRHLRQSLDRNGTWASGSEPLRSLLSRLLSEPYFSKPAPKSCGRELFNLRWLERFLEPPFDPQAIQATLLELTVESVARCIEMETYPPDRLILCGGGAKNATLVRRLSARLSPLPVTTSAEFGLEVSLVEATAFAWLAKRTLQNQPGNLPAVTGARGLRVLGAIYPA